MFFSIFGCHSEDQTISGLFSLHPSVRRGTETKTHSHLIRLGLSLSFVPIVYLHICDCPVGGCVTPCHSSSFLFREDLGSSESETILPLPGILCMCVQKLKLWSVAKRPLTRETLAIIVGLAWAFCPSLHVVDISALWDCNRGCRLEMQKYTELCFWFRNRIWRNRNIYFNKWSKIPSSNFFSNLFMLQKFRLLLWSLTLAWVSIE